MERLRKTLTSRVRNCLWPAARAVRTTVCHIATPQTVCCCCCCCCRRRPSFDARLSGSGDDARLRNGATKEDIDITREKRSVASYGRVQKHSVAVLSKDDWDEIQARVVKNKMD